MRPTAEHPTAEHPATEHPTAERQTAEHQQSSSHRGAVEEGGVHTPDRLEEERRAAVRQALGALSGIVPVGIIAVDAAGRPWYRNQRWLDLRGPVSPPRDHHPWYAAVHPHDRDVMATRWRDCVERRGRLGEFRVVGEDGAVRNCRADAVAMVGLGGSIDGYLVIVSDPDPATGGRSLGALSTAHVLDVVLDRSPDIVTILNADGSWRWSNAGAIRVVGHQDRFDPKDGLFSFVHPQDEAAARAFLARAAGGTLGSDERLELRIRAADGTYRWMEALIDVLLDEPAVRGFVVHLRDVTERRRVLGALEATNRRLVDLIVSMRTAVLLEDERQHVVLANRAFVDLFRLPTAPEDLTGRTLESLGVTADRIVAEPAGAGRLLDDLRASGERREGIRCVLFDGRTIECDFVPVVVNGVNRGHLSCFRDVTDQARAEAERERLLVSEREENRRLTELDAYRSESIAAVSHELRTPLTSIVGYAQLLQSMLGADASPEQAVCIDAIVRNVDRLLRLAGDVVALDSLESRTLPLPVAPVDVRAVVRRAVQTIGPAAAEKGVKVTLRTEPGPALQGDEDRLAQLFENLLSNAVKFTLPDGEILIRAAPARSRGSAARRGMAASQAGAPSGPRWEITIADNGIGIPEDEIGMLFTRFFRASNARRRGFPGSGLGLSVAKAIAERHAGELAVSSAVGVGTTVTVRLADARESAGAPSETGRGDPTQV